MNRQYDDLLALTDRKPSFFQVGGVPRWADFRPGDSTDIYAQDCAIVEIACQMCDHRFHVLMESTNRNTNSIADDIKTHALAYRDPPNVGCCGGGPSTTSEIVRVIEYWRREETFVWKRDRSLEVEFHRYGGPLTADLLEKVKAAIADPNTDEEHRLGCRELLEHHQESLDDAATRPPPEYASDFRTTAVADEDADAPSGHDAEQQTRTDP